MVSGDVEEAVAMVDDGSGRDRTALDGKIVV